MSPARGRSARRGAAAPGVVAVEAGDVVIYSALALSIATFRRLSPKRNSLPLLNDRPREAPGLVVNAKTRLPSALRSMTLSRAIMHPGGVRSSSSQPSSVRFLGCAKDESHFGPAQVKPCHQSPNLLRYRRAVLRGSARNFARETCEFRAVFRVKK